MIAASRNPRHYKTGEFYSEREREYRTHFCHVTRPLIGWRKFLEIMRGCGASDWPSLFFHNIGLRLAIGQKFSLSLKLSWVQLRVPEATTHETVFDNPKMWSIGPCWLSTVLIKSCLITDSVVFAGYPISFRTPLIDQQLGTISSDLKYFNLI